MAGGIDLIAFHTSIVTTERARNEERKKILYEKERLTAKHKSQIYFIIVCILRRRNYAETQTNRRLKNHTISNVLMMMLHT